MYHSTPNLSEHLGLLPAQPPFNEKEQPTWEMRPAPVPDQYDFGSREDKAVEDILSDDFEKLWVTTGRSNRAAFEKVFRPVPNDTIKNWKDYAAYLKPNAGIAVGLVPLVSSVSSHPTPLRISVVNKA